MNNDTNQTEVIEHKISSQSIRDVAAYFDLSLKALANVIECNPAQIYNNPNRLSSASAQHILQLSHLMCITTTYFGSVSRAKKWFAQNNIVLDAKPIELCSTAQGIKQIENSIMRLTHGMTA